MNYRVIKGNCRRQKRQNERQNGIGDAIQRSHRKIIVIGHVVAVGLQAQLERVHQLLAQQRRQELVVGDVLNLRSHNSTGFLLSRETVSVVSRQVEKLDCGGI